MIYMHNEKKLQERTLTNTFKAVETRRSLAHVTQIGSLSSGNM